MRAGKLDRLVTIQRKTDTQSESGQPFPTWSAIVHRRAAQVSPVRGDERFAGPQLAASEQTEFRIRWSQALADLHPGDRLLYPPPAIQNEQSPATSTIYDIIAVNELGRREGFAIVAWRRPDVSP